MEFNIETSWQEQLKEELTQPYVSALASFVEKEFAEATIFPQPENIFRAFELCPFEQVKVVILGQDPYHGEGQANGLCFAVAEHTPLPPSLKNIFKELEQEFAKPLVHTSGDLSRWARQGVLLLNATLTVRKQTPGSHQKQGWEEFTDAVIRTLSQQREHIVFMLWGNYAKAKGAHIDRTKHIVLEAAHPSPFSAYNGFFGCGHFRAANEYLQKHGTTPIDWL